MSSPDLTFYYYTAEQTTDVTYDNNIATGSVRECPIYAEPELINKIGNKYSNRIIFKKNGSDVKSRITEKIFSFPFGSLVGQHSRSKKTGSTTLSTITSGNGDFFGSTGSIVTIKDETRVNKVLVYFSK